MCPGGPGGTCLPRRNPTSVYKWRRSGGAVRGLGFNGGIAGLDSAGKAEPGVTWHKLTVVRLLLHLSLRVMSLFDGLRQIWEVATLGEEEVGAQMQRLIVTGERCWELVQGRGGKPPGVTWPDPSR